ncbi:MAG: hypothetical protein O7E53_02660 [Alphaproteobacteria bacterium]|nr:hypothetical protein [Alphaproteobacteria bacterium]
MFYMGGENQFALFNKGGYMTPIYDDADPRAFVTVGGNPVPAYALGNKSGNGDYAGDQFGDQLITEHGVPQTFSLEKSSTSLTGDPKLTVFETVARIPRLLVSRSFPGVEFPPKFDFSRYDLSGFDLSQCKMTDVDLTRTAGFNGIELSGGTLNKVSFKG